MAILIIALSYIFGILFFTVLFTYKTYYCIFALAFPLFGYFWLITFGAKYVNNHYGFKKTPDGIMIYTKKKQRYSTFVFIHAVIFLFSSIVRLIYEINNLLLIKQELHKVL